MLRAGVEALAAGPLSQQHQEAMLDLMQSFLVAKNGSALVHEDHEDRAVRACWAALPISWSHEDTPFEIADYAAGFLDGTVGETLINP